MPTPGAFGKKYISRAQKRDLGIPVNIYDAARSLNEKRMSAGEERRPLRAILKEEDFRRNWNIWKNQDNSFLDRARAANYWGWFERTSDGRRWRYVS